MKIPRLLLILPVLGYMSSAAASCGSAFCPVTSGPVIEPLWSDTGTSLDLRYEYINQNQLRSGRGRAVAGEGSEDHTEIGTINRNLLATYTRTFAAGWGVTALVPVVARDHRHLLAGDDVEPELQRWTFTRLGDVRLLGKYELTRSAQASSGEAAGLTFGLKLPTGSTTIRNNNGARAERSLQPGSGTTDAVLGAYYRRGKNTGAAWFVQGQYQHAVNTHEDFRPGAQAGFDAGVRYGWTPDFSLIAQVNAVLKQRDSGAQAEPEESGARLLFVSPGVGYALSTTAQVYGFVQKPVYQYVNGSQLTARTSFVVGLTCHF